eukprot:gene25310-10965_t
MLSAHLSSSLVSAGLERFVPHFSDLNDHQFCALCVQEYSRYGLEELGDKQKLFRLLKMLNPDQKPKVACIRDPPRKKMGVRAGVELLDLECHDGDLLEFPKQDQSGVELVDLDCHDGDSLQYACGPALQQPPMVAAKAVPPANAPSVQAGTAPALSPETAVDPPKIRVVVRKRPINKKEIARGEEDVCDCSMANSYIEVNEIKQKVDLTKYTERSHFKFDVALDESVSNEQVYQLTVQPLVGTLLRNGKASCFAYGQTGSGKTHTMSPLPIRAAADIFQHLAKPQHKGVSLYLSCFEIYGNKVYDLLNARKPLNIMEDSKKKVVVVGLKEYNVTSVDLVKQLIAESSSKRSTGSTGANADSSRSHSIMQFALKRPNPDAGKLGRGRARAGELPPSDFLVGKISFIDLAGSERGADTADNNRQTRMEGAEINKSLLALKECIRALDGHARLVPFRGSKLTAECIGALDGHARHVPFRGSKLTAECIRALDGHARLVPFRGSKLTAECIRALDGDARHVPFRGSKLTAVLRDSFIGAEARTVMIANISPCSNSTEHTLNTLRYADRVKELRKDKAARAPGGVTPGEDPAYYAAVERAYADSSNCPDQDLPLLSPKADKPALRPTTASPYQSPRKAVGARVQTVRGARKKKKNAVLAADLLDQPGSAIDQYVDQGN